MPTHQSMQPSKWTQSERLGLGGSARVALDSRIRAYIGSSKNWCFRIWDSQNILPSSEVVGKYQDYQDYRYYLCLSRVKDPPRLPLASVKVSMYTTVVCGRWPGYLHAWRLRIPHSLGWISSHMLSCGAKTR